MCSTIEGMVFGYGLSDVHSANGRTGVTGVVDAMAYTGAVSEEAEEKGVINAEEEEEEEGRIVFSEVETFSPGSSSESLEASFSSRVSEHDPEAKGVFTSKGFPTLARNFDGVVSLHDEIALFEVDSSLKKQLQTLTLNPP